MAIGTNMLVFVTLESWSVQLSLSLQLSFVNRGCRLGRDLMVVGFTTTYAISAYHH